MEVDYLVVGCGLAGINFCHLLETHGKSFLVFDNASQHSSTVAGGLYNPVVLKRFTSVWKSDEQLKLLSSVYPILEKKLNRKLDFALSVRRVFHSTEEQNNWFVASDKRELAPYLSTELIKNHNDKIHAPFGFGKVLHTGRIDTQALVTSYKSHLIALNRLVEEGFNYEELIIKEAYSVYQNIKARHVVFAEGFGLKNNPFFKDLPLTGTKGELLTIQAPELKIDFVLKSNVFLIPFGNDHYRVGATYEWEDKSNKPTENAKTELLSKLDTVISCPYEVMEQHAGIRPTVIDRRPLVGSHSHYKNLHVLNGLGTRGVMIAPFVAKALFAYLEEGKALDKEIDIRRFLN